jgi:hypothetical protein
MFHEVKTLRNLIDHPASKHERPVSNSFASRLRRIVFTGWRQQDGFQRKNYLPSLELEPEILSEVACEAAERVPWVEVN